MELARSKRWAEAAEAFQAGWHKAPRDKRFPLELAGINFKQQDFRAAKTHLKEALQLDPVDSYANDFLATLYYLDGNLDAALEYWNRSGKPRIEEILFDPEPRVDPVLLDRAFTFSRASVLERRDLLTTKAHIEGLAIFPRYRFELVPRAGDRFDLSFRAIERNGWGDNKIDGLAGLLRGLPFQAVYPEFYNLGRSAWNVQSLLRWDPQKRRVFAGFGGPLRRDPKWGLRFYLDGRDEDWELASASSGELKLQKIESGAEIRSIVNERWTWSSGVSVAARRFRGESAPVFTDGFSLKYRAGFGYEILRIPERRLTVTSGGSWQLGRMFAPSGVFSRAEGSLELRWFPLARGDDYQSSARYRAGKTFGRVPFDELFMLGLERDNDLWLRGHIGTRHGKKGSAPLGRDYMLVNFETEKILRRISLFALSLAPFVDTGSAYGFGPSQWLWDTGAEFKVRTPAGLAVVFSYGKDLRSGRNAWYGRVEKSVGGMQ